MNADETKCPFCGETIKAAALKCRFCGEFIRTPEGAEPNAASIRAASLKAAPRPPARVLYSGPVSPIVLLGPALVTVAWTMISILVGFGLTRAQAGGARPVMSPAMIAGALSVLGLIQFAVAWLQWRTRTFKITTDRVELEYGIFSRSLRSLDMWRVQDLAHDQTFIQRLLGLGLVRVISSDKDTPWLDVGPIRGARELYAQLKQAQLDADRSKGVVRVEQ